MDTIYDIKVTEYPIVVKDSIDESWKTVPEFNITVKTSQYTLYVIRYIPDLQSFDHMIKTHYQKIKIPFPTLTESLSKVEKRKSIRNFFHIHVKSNAEKVEKYLYRCSTDSVLKSSTLLRDFFTPQRDGDTSSRKLSHDGINAYPSPSQSSYDPMMMSTPNDDASDHDSSVDFKKVWVPSPHPSVVSLSKSSILSSLNNGNNESNLSLLSYSYPSSRHSDHKEDIEEDYEDEDHDEDGSDLVHILRKDEEEDFAYEFPLDHLEMIKVLGKGCMGKVLLVRSRKTRELYALKSILKEHVIEQREITHTLDERNILTKLSAINHPYLAKLHTSFQDEHRLYLLTNYYCGGDLATHMAKLYSFPKECAMFYAAEIIDGIGELHKLGVLYRDLKPENILLTGDGHIILTDFGLSKWLEPSENYSTQTFCGTAEYLAPEVLLGESYSFGIDHWSFGTILYEMLAGITPFWADNHADMYRRVLEDPLEFPADIFDYETAEFISDILDRDPRTRLGANGVDEIKDHVYFADISWDDIRNRRLQPPYLPPVTDNELDFKNFDPDFLAMTPQLTPVPSEVEFSDEIQDIFDNYSFTDEHYQEYEQQQSVRIIYPRQSNREDGFYSETQEQQRHREEEEYDDEDDEEELEQPPPLFQPARKRGSISMLSNVDSFCLDDDVLVKPSFAKDNHHPVEISSSFKDEEHARYAKRRNTSASEDHHTLPVDQYTTTKTPLTANKSINNNSTLVVINSHHIPSRDTSFDVLEFSKLPDLKLSFNMDQPNTKMSKSPPSNNSTKSSHQSKTRRFFSLLL